MRNYRTKSYTLKPDTVARVAQIAQEWDVSESRAAEWMLQEQCDKVQGKDYIDGDIRNPKPKKEV